MYLYVEISKRTGTAFFVASCKFQITVGMRGRLLSFAQRRLPTGRYFYAQKPKNFLPLYHVEIVSTSVAIAPKWVMFFEKPVGVFCLRKALLRRNGERRLTLSGSRQKHKDTVLAKSIEGGDAYGCMHRNQAKENPPILGKGRAGAYKEQINL